MKTYSISAVIVLALSLGFVSDLTNFDDNLVSAKVKTTGKSESVVSAPKAFISGTYTGNGFYTYVKTLTLNAACSCTWYVADVPNQISIKDSNGNSVYSLSWRGTANYPGPWGTSISTGNTFYFGLSAGTYTIYVDTVTNVSNGGSSDAWYIYY